MTSLYNGSIHRGRELFGVTVITEHMEADCRAAGLRVGVCRDATTAFQLQGLVFVCHCATNPMQLNSSL